MFKLVLLSAIVSVTLASIQENSAICLSSDNYYGQAATKDCCAATQGSPIFYDSVTGICINADEQGINYDAFNSCCNSRGWNSASSADPCKFQTVNNIPTDGACIIIQHLYVAKIVQYLPPITHRVALVCNISRPIAARTL